MPIYLNLGGVRGESEAERHEGWIELETFSFGTVSTKTKNPNQIHNTSQNATIQEAFCTRDSDSTSVTLNQLSFRGSVRQAAVDYVTPRGEIYLQLRFEDARIASHSFSNAANGPPVETFSLVFTKWRTEFYRQLDSLPGQASP